MNVIPFFKDLLIGSYASQQVFLLRLVILSFIIVVVIIIIVIVCVYSSHAVATVPVTISSSPSIVNLTLTNCMLNEMNYAWLDYRNNLKYIYNFTIFFLVLL